MQRLQSHSSLLKWSDSIAREIGADGDWFIGADIDLIRWSVVSVLVCYQITLVVNFYNDFLSTADLLKKTITMLLKVIKMYVFIT